MNLPRLVVAGSRGWRNRHRIYAELDRAAIHLGFLSTTAPTNAGAPMRREILQAEMRLIHGAAEGADAMANTWAALYHPYVVVERYPYPKLLGRRGGPHRNAYMLGLGADLCVAFLMPCTRPDCRREGEHDSHGSANCADTAESLSIETWRIRP